MPVNKERKNVAKALESKGLQPGKRRENHARRPIEAHAMRSVLSFCLVLLLSVSLAVPLAYAADPAPQPIPKVRPIFFPRGSTGGTAGGHVLRGNRNLYSVTATQGQVLTVTITAPDDNAVFQIYEPDTKVQRDADGALEFVGKALSAVDSRDDATRWSGRLPRTGTYLIAVGSTRGDARYSIDVKVE